MSIKTGTDALREALRVRMKKSNISGLARDVGDAAKTPIGVGAVEDFATANANLPEPVLQALARALFGSNVSLDVQRNLLVRAKIEPLPAAVSPPQFDPKTSPYYRPVPTYTRGPQPLKPERPQKIPARPGWAT